MGKLNDPDYMPWRDQVVLDIIGDNMWHDTKSDDIESELDDV